MNLKEYNIKNINPISNKEEADIKVKEVKPEEENKNTQAEDKKRVRRSSLRGNTSYNKLDQNNLLKFAKGKRHSVSFGQVNTFQFKKMKANFEEKNDDVEQKKINKEEHNKFVQFRKKSIKNEFLLVKEMLKKDQNTIKELEDSDDEVKKNTDKNVKLGREELKEENSSDNSNDSESENSEK